MSHLFSEAAIVVLYHMLIRISLPEMSVWVLVSDFIYSSPTCVLFKNYSFFSVLINRAIILSIYCKFLDGTLFSSFIETRHFWGAVSFGCSGI